jgi:hypothetical protein
MDFIDKIEAFKYSEYRHTHYYSMLKDMRLRDDVDAMNTPEKIAATVEGESIIIVIHGDLTIDRNLVIDDLFSYLYKKYSKDQAVSIPLIFFTGTIVVEGAIAVRETEYLSNGVVFVGGVKCNDLFTAGISLVFLEEVEITRLYMYRSQGEGECIAREEILAPIKYEYDSCTVRNKAQEMMFWFSDPTEIPEVAFKTTFKCLSDYFVFDDDSGLYYFDEEKVGNTFENYLMDFAMNSPKALLS